MSDKKPRKPRTIGPAQAAARDLDKAMARSQFLRERIERHEIIIRELRRELTTLSNVENKARYALAEASKVTEEEAPEPPAAA